MTEVSSGATLGEEDARGALDGRVSRPTDAYELRPHGGGAIDRPDIWAVGGGKGGVGKSIVAANIALGAARRGLRVVLADLDLGGGNQHTLFGMDRPHRSLEDFVAKLYPKLDDVVLPTPFPNLGIVCSRSDLLGAANPSHAQKLKLLRHLASLDADVVVCDLGAGTSYNTLDIFLAAHVQLVVTVPEPTAIQNAYGFMKSCTQRAAQERASDGGAVGRSLSPRLVVNACNRADAPRVHAALASTMHRFGHLAPPLLGAISRDAVVGNSVVAATPVTALAPSSVASRDFDAIAARLVSERFGRGQAVDPPRASTPAPGFNSDIELDGVVFHVQTEDLGRDKAQVRTQVFVGGTAIFTKVFPYGAVLRAERAAASSVGGTEPSPEPVRYQHHLVIEAIRARRIREPGR